MSQYDDETEYIYFYRFINPLYKNIRVSNSNIGVSGVILYADQQVEAVLENLKIDLYRTTRGVFLDMTCRDPSIIFNTTLNIINVELYYSQDRIELDNRYNPIRYLGAGNVNYLNLTSNVFVENPFNRVSYNYLDESCVMESGKHPILNITNAYFTVPRENISHNIELNAPISINSFTDRAVNGTQVYITNMTLENMRIYGLRAISLEVGPYSEIYFKDITFKNMELTQQIFQFRNGGIVSFENFNIIN